MNKHINRFHTQLNNYQTLVSKKIKSNLIDEWHIKPTSKKKKFYKIYWVLRKNELISKDKSVLKQGWIFSSSKTNYKRSHIYKKQVSLKTLDILNKPAFYKKNKVKNFAGGRLKGYTSYGESIVDYKNI